MRERNFRASVPLRGISLISISDDALSWIFCAAKCSLRDKSSGVIFVILNYTHLLEKDLN